MTTPTTRESWIWRESRRCEPPGSATCALLSDHSVKCWGKNNVGQLGLGNSSSNDVLTPHTVTFNGASTPLSLHAGRNEFCAQLDNGSAACWGQNADGQFGLGNTTSQTSPCFIGFTTWKNVSMDMANISRASATTMAPLCALEETRSIRLGKAQHQQRNCHGNTSLGWTWLLTPLSSVKTLVVLIWSTEAWPVGEKMHGACLVTARPRTHCVSPRQQPSTPTLETAEQLHPSA